MQSVPGGSMQVCKGWRARLEQSAGLNYGRVASLALGYTLS
jgi:hypothetical protein